MRFLFAESPKPSGVLKQEMSIGEEEPVTTLDESTAAGSKNLMSSEEVKNYQKKQDKECKQSVSKEYECSTNR